MKKYKIIDINGSLEVPEHLTLDQVNDLFIDWVESQAFFFGGGMGPSEDKELYKIEMETEQLQKDFEEKYEKLGYNKVSK